MEVAVVSLKNYKHLWNKKICVSNPTPLLPHLHWLTTNWAIQFEVKNINDKLKKGTI